MTIELQKEPLISFIVPVYKVDKDLFNRCLMSLIKQDYKNFEIICTFDGVDPELLKVATSFHKDKRVRIIEIKHAGAPAARNAGFEASKGEIVSFFNSDYIAKRGMTRTWIDELQTHPDCGFIYGAYEYGTKDRAWYPSKKFNPWELKQANYIDCGFPIWRKHVVKWDENCKSLQDWDFWLWVVFGDPVEEDVKVKGHFLGREISFVAQVPLEGGLSYDSEDHWIERVLYIREKHRISTSQMVVTSLGAPYHGTEIAKMIGADYRDDTIFKKNEYKAIYMIGFYTKPTDEGNPHAQVLQRYDKQVKIVHFVGADIYWLRKFTHEDLKYIAGALNLKVDHILCETDLAQKELEEMGIHSKVVPISPYQDFDITPLPEKFSVAILLTDKSDFDKYCKEKTLSIVRAMPDVQFQAYGDGCKNLIYPNIKHAGNLNKEDWKKFVYGNSCLLRIVNHDTRPMASDEFIMAGRDVVTNVPTAYMEYIKTGGDVDRNEWDTFASRLSYTQWPSTKKKIVQKVREVRKAQPYSLNRREKASQYFKDVLNREKYIHTIKTLGGTL